MNQVLYTAAEIVNVVPEILIIALFFHRIFKRKYQTNIQYIIGYVLAFVILSAVSLLQFSAYTRIAVTFVILISLCFSLYSGLFIVKIFSGIYYILIVFISETLFVGILTLTGQGNPMELLQSGLGRIIGMIGTKIFDFWIIVYSCRIYKSKIKSLPLKYWILIILMPFLSAVILNLIFYSNNVSNASAYLQAGFVISLVGLLYLNLSVFNYFESYDKQIKLAALEKILEREDENYRTLAGSYDEIRNIKHDLKNQVELLNNLIKDKNYSAAEEHMKRLYNTVETATSVCYTGNSSVDSIINLKGDYAKNNSIIFTTKIRVEKIEFDSVGLCRILGNALDNAIEACQRLNSEEKYICLAINQLDNKLIIEISNTTAPVDINNLATSKENKAIHGIGMQSIKQTVSNMGGIMSCSYESGYFMMEIVLTKQ